MVGVWADPVTAHVMMTLRAGMDVLLAVAACAFHDANAHRII
jgi:hypothetical protein